MKTLVIGGGGFIDAHQISSLLASWRQVAVPERQHEAVSKLPLAAASQSVLDWLRSRNG